MKFKNLIFTILALFVIVSPDVARAEIDSTLTQAQKDNIYMSGILKKTQNFSSDNQKTEKNTYDLTVDNNKYTCTNGAVIDKNINTIERFDDDCSGNTKKHTFIELLYENKDTVKIQLACCVGDDQEIKGVEIVAMSKRTKYYKEYNILKNDLNKKWTEKDYGAPDGVLKNQLADLTKIYNALVTDFNNKMNNKEEIGGIKRLVVADSEAVRLNNKKEVISPVAETEHEKNKKDLLDWLGSEYDKLKKEIENKITAVDAAKIKACTDAIARLKKTYQKHWGEIVAAARNASGPKTARVRADELTAAKKSFDNDFKSEFSALYDGPGACAGLTPRQSPDGFLAPINTEYEKLLQELKSQMSAAEKKCADAEKTTHYTLKNEWDKTEKTAKDKGAELDPQIRKQNAAAVIEPAIDNCKISMAGLYKPDGACAGITPVWNANSDEFLLGIISDWEKLQRELDGEKPVDYRDEAEVKKLQENADAAKKTEQSTANKLLGGAAIGAAGIGGMQLMQGMAEKSSDSDAAREMAEYQKTFRCGVGTNGPMNVGMDGKSHEIFGYTENAIKLKDEYVTQATFSKNKKSALGMIPGIESETILNTDNLYQSGAANAGTVNHFDTAQQRIDSGAANKKMLIGGAALGVGVVGGFVGDALINKEKSVFGKLTDQAESKEQIANSKEQKEKEKTSSVVDDLRAKVVPVAKEVVANKKSSVVGGTDAVVAVTVPAVIAEADNKEDTKIVNNTNAAAAVIPVPVKSTAEVVNDINHPNDEEKKKIKKFGEACKTKNGIMTDRPLWNDELIDSAIIHAEYRCYINDEWGTVYDICKDVKTWGKISGFVGSQESGQEKKFGCMLNLPWRRADGTTINVYELDRSKMSGESQD